MINHIKRLLGIGQKPVAPTAPAPYKVDAPVSEPVAPAPAPKPAKKPAAKKAVADKPKAPRKPKAPKA
jgi:hypothetical protein